MSVNYWMHVFYPDGREEKAFKGAPPVDERGKVVVFIDSRCKRGNYHGRRDAAARTVVTPVDDTPRTLETSDFVMRFEGSRILKFMPKVKMVSVV